MINLDRVDRMAGLVFQNCIRLHLDSIALFNNKSYPSGYYLSVSALEEYGKIFYMDDLLWHSSVEGKWEKEQDERWLESIFFHTYKQRTFAHHLERNLPKKYIEIINSGKLDIDKQNAIHVGLPKGKRRVDINGKIINPLKINIQKAEKQITVVNDCILENMLGTIKGIYSFQSRELSSLITRKLHKKLREKWGLSNPKVQRQINRLEQLEDDEDR